MLRLWKALRRKQTDGFSLCEAYIHSQPLQTSSAYFEQKKSTQFYIKYLEKCIDEALLRQGRCLQGHLIKSGRIVLSSISNRVMRLYARCQRPEDARQMFDEITERDSFSWNIIISAYSKAGLINEARDLFQKMPERGIVAWNSMISGYVENGQSEKALKCFREMHGQGVDRDRFTLCSALLACNLSRRLQVCRQIHADASKKGLEFNTFVGSALVDCYCKQGLVECARQVFDEMSERDIVTWTAMISGYAQKGLGFEALQLFQEMQKAGEVPNQMTYSAALSACASIAGLQQGSQVHARLLILGFTPNAVLTSALMDMYAKCGFVHYAKALFDKISKPDVVTWNVMITGYALNGCLEEAIGLFGKMLVSSAKPDQSTFFGVLSACHHGGLAEKALHYFNLMKDFGIEAQGEHYACIVDLLGKTGNLKQAEEIINSATFRPNAVIWGALLSACRLNRNVELGERAALKLFELEPEKASSYVQLANIYASVGRWDDVARVRKAMNEKGLVKDAACSWIQVKGKVFNFVANDTSHGQRDEIYRTLGSLIEQIRSLGYVPNKSFALHDCNDEHKEQSLFYHSEKLAMAFGHMSVPAGMPLRITKNLRICGDCHNAAKYVSLVVGRLIIIRDSNRFHHFKDGLCSCRDFW